MSFWHKKGKKKGRKNASGSDGDDDTDHSSRSHHSQGERMHDGMNGYDVGGGGGEHPRQMGGGRGVAGGGMGGGGATHVTAVSHQGLPSLHTGASSSQPHPSQLAAYHRAYQSAVLSNQAHPGYIDPRAIGLPFRSDAFSPHRTGDIPSLSALEMAESKMNGYGAGPVGASGVSHVPVIQVHRYPHSNGLLASGGGGEEEPNRKFSKSQSMSHSVNPHLGTQLARAQSHGRPDMTSPTITMDPDMERRLERMEGVIQAMSSEMTILREALALSKLELNSLRRQNTLRSLKEGILAVFESDVYTRQRMSVYDLSSGHSKDVLQRPIKLLQHRKIYAPAYCAVALDRDELANLGCQIDPSHWNDYAAIPVVTRFHNRSNCANIINSSLMPGLDCWDLPSLPNVNLKRTCFSIVYSRVLGFVAIGGHDLNDNIQLETINCLPLNSFAKKHQRRCRQRVFQRVSKFGGPLGYTNESSQSGSSRLASRKVRGSGPFREDTLTIDDSAMVDGDSKEVSTSQSDEASVSVSLRQERERQRNRGGGGQPFQLQWMELNCMGYSRRNPTACVSRYSGKESIFVCGGYNSTAASREKITNQCEVLDVESLQWHKINPMNTRRHAAGCCVDIRNSRSVYVCGGYNDTAMFSCEEFVVHKNKWYDLPLMKHKHQRNPVIKMKGDANTIVVFGDDLSKDDYGFIEMYDKRDSSKKWRTLGRVQDALGTDEAFRGDVRGFVTTLQDV